VVDFNVRGISNPDLFMKIERPVPRLTLLSCGGGQGAGSSRNGTAGTI
jgi:hypothetical protein